MTAERDDHSDDHVNGGPVSSRRRKNSVPNWYFRSKYIDTKIKCIYLFTYFVSCLFTLDAPSHLHKNPEAGLFFPFDRSSVEF